MAGEPVHFQIKFIDSTAKWTALQQKRGFAAIQLMGSKILSLAQMKVPKAQTKKLWGSAKIQTSGKDEVKISFGGGSVAYAAYQERGHRFDGSRQVHNYTTPGTGAHYLEESGKQVAKEGISQWLHLAS